jgi:hypothetical protein
MRWLDRWLGRTPPAAPLRGAPAVRRQKTYSAQSGFVYQYFYEGYREASRAGLPGHEYVFRVTRAAESYFPLTVFLAAAAVESWQRAHGRHLSTTEQYAAVKMALFEAFDERPDLGPGAADVEIDADRIQAHLGTLDID